MDQAVFLVGDAVNSEQVVKECFDYFTTVMGLFDRKIIGWSFRSDMTDETDTK